MYFNLIIRADESQAVHHSRMFEYTAPEVKRLFEQDDEPDLSALCELPTIMVKEFGPETGKQTARIGYIDSPSMCPTMKNPIFCFPSDLLIERQILGGKTYTPNQLKWVGQHTGWTVFEGDPFRILFGDGFPGAAKAVQSAPIDETKAVQSAPIDETLIAVMMPFNRGHHSVDRVFGAIRNGVEAVGKTARRVDELNTPTDIPDDVRNLIRSSYGVIVDLTGLNSNVLYELGFADGLGKIPILIHESPIGKLPFDFSSRRVFTYHDDKEGLEIFSRKLSDILREL